MRKRYNDHFLKERTLREADIYALALRLRGYCIKTEKVLDAC